MIRSIHLFAAGVLAMSSICLPQTVLGFDWGGLKQKFEQIINTPSLPSDDEAREQKAQEEVRSKSLQNSEQKSSSANNEIREIQLELTRLGYRPGSPDGLFGSKTKLAIQEFQRESGSEPTGQPSTALLEQLRMTSARHPTTDAPALAATSKSGKSEQQITNNVDSNTPEPCASELEPTVAVNILRSSGKKRPASTDDQIHIACALVGEAKKLSCFAKHLQGYVQEKLDTSEYVLKRVHVSIKDAESAERWYENVCINKKFEGRAKDCEKYEAMAQPTCDLMVHQYRPCFATVTIPDAELYLQKAEATLCNNVLSQLQGERNFSGLDVSRCGELGKVSLRGADLHNSNFQRSNLSDMDLSGADLTGARISESDFSRVNLEKADLRDAWIEKSAFAGVNARGAKFSKSSISATDLRGANFDDTDFRSAEFDSASQLADASFRNANMAGVKLRSTSLAGVDLTGARVEHYFLELNARHLDKAIGLDASVDAITGMVAANQPAQQRTRTRHSDGSTVAEALIKHFSGKQVSYKSPPASGQPGLDISVFVCSNGQFLFKDNLLGSDDTGNIGGGLALRTGNWRAMSEGSRGFLELQFADGEVATYEAMVSGGMTYVDGDLVQLSDENPLCK